MQPFAEHEFGGFELKCVVAYKYSDTYGLTVWLDTGAKIKFTRKPGYELKQLIHVYLAEKDKDGE